MGFGDILDKRAEKLPRVLVMMASYNGELYISEQIESILAQHDVEVFLQISDDGSSDNTCEICESYAAKYPRVNFRKNSQNKGYSNNFMDMVYDANASEYDYFAFSDQDDFWLPNKLIKAISSIEASGTGPRLYFSDISNVDANLGNEKRECIAYAPFSSSFKLALVTNWVAGCTMVFNSKFVKALQDGKPKKLLRHHDSWLHLVAIACGWSVPDYEHSYILRRITGNNAVGESFFGKLSIKRVKNAFVMMFGKNDEAYLETALSLQEGFSPYMLSDAKDSLDTFLLDRRSLSGRIKLALDKGYYGPYRVENSLYAIKMILGLY